MTPCVTGRPALLLTTSYQFQCGGGAARPTAQLVLIRKHKNLFSCWTSSPRHPSKWPNPMTSHLNRALGSVLAAAAIVGVIVVFVMVTRTSVKLEEGAEEKVVEEKGSNTLLSELNDSHRREVTDLRVNQTENTDSKIYLD